MIGLWVALAGGVGAAARAWLEGGAAARLGGRAPWGTAIVNLSGSLLIGVIAGLGASAFVDVWRDVLSIGFLGGYTTFSTAAVQTAEMLVERRWQTAAVYGFGLRIAAGLFAAAGLWLGRALGSG